MKLVLSFLLLTLSIVSATSDNSKADEYIQEFIHATEKNFTKDGQCSESCMKKLAESAQAIIDRKSADSEKFRRAVCVQYGSLKEGRFCLPVFQSICKNVRGIDSVTACIDKIKSFTPKTKEAIRDFNKETRGEVKNGGQCNEACIKNLVKQAQSIIERHDDADAAQFRRAICQKYAALEEDSFCLAEFHKICESVVDIDSVTACMQKVKSASYKAKAVGRIAARQGVRAFGGIPGYITVRAAGTALATLEKALSTNFDSKRSSGVHLAKEGSQAVWHKAGKFGRTKIKGKIYLED